MKTKIILMFCFALLATVFTCFGVSEAFSLAPQIASDGLSAHSGQFASDVLSPGLVGGINYAFAWGSLVMPAQAGYEDGVENMGGFGILAYIALYDDIDVWPTEVETPTTLAEMVELEGNFTMKASKYFLKVYVSPNTLDLNPEGQGEAGGRSFKPKGSFLFPTFSATNRGLSRRLNNARGVLIIPDDTGNFRHLLGSETRPVFFKPSGTSGKNAADPKGFNFDFDCDSFAPTYTYNGTIALNGETLPVIS